MNGAQDLGGMMGFGPVVAEPDEPVFHADWEPRVLALTLAAGACGRWSGDASRFARESLHPATYLTSTYYEIWLAALEKVVVQSGLVGPHELERGKAVEPGVKVERILQGPQTAEKLAAGWPSDRTPPREPHFRVGDTVRMRNMHPRGHTRLPRYARGRTGVIEAVRGCFVFPDTNAAGVEDPQWCYAVRFEARELWGEDAAPGLLVNIDAFEPYLEAPQLRP